MPWTEPSQEAPGDVCGRRGGVRRGADAGGRSQSRVFLGRRRRTRDPGHRLRVASSVSLQENSPRFALDFEASRNGRRSRSVVVFIKNPYLVLIEKP